jgi:hypothetical protein
MKPFLVKIRSLSIREVDAGSCNGCELEIHALNNAFYDLERDASPDEWLLTHSDGKGWEYRVRDPVGPLHGTMRSAPHYLSRRHCPILGE